MNLPHDQLAGFLEMGQALQIKGSLLKYTLYAPLLPKKNRHYFNYYFKGLMNSVAGVADNVALHPDENELNRLPQNSNNLLDLGAPSAVNPPTMGLSEDSGAPLLVPKVEEESDDEGSYLGVTEDQTDRSDEESASEVLLPLLIIIMMR